MQHNLRRGLAASAVAALAVSGLTIAAAPAHAADSDDVRMISQLGGKASVRVNSDGFSPIASSSIALVAERLDPEVTIDFEYHTDPDADDAAAGWNHIASVAPPGRFARVSWSATVDGQSLAGSSVALRAVAVTEAGSTYSTLNGVEITGPESDVHSVSSVIDGGGYFVQPYADAGRTATLARVRGTTSATDGVVELAWWRSSDGSFQGQADAAVTRTTLKAFDPNDSIEEIPAGRFSTVLDITGYDAAASDDALAVRAVRDTDGVAVQSAVYEQAVTDVYADTTKVTSNGVTVRVDVRDQHGWSIGGAEVRRQSDGSLVGYTGSTGSVEIQQDNETTESYYVNTTDVDAFEEGTDPVTSPYLAPAYVPVPTAMKVVLADGDVFDDDEYAEGDVILQVVDQEGTPLAAENEEVSYAVHPSSDPEPARTTATTDADGQVVVPFDPSGPDGEYTLVHTGPASSDPGESSATFVAGDARLRLSPARGRARAGGKATFVGHLAIGDLPLEGRRVDLSFTRGVERAPGGRADAGILVDGARRLAARATTAADGSFLVTIDDKRESGRPTERGGELRAVAPGAQEQDTAVVDFGIVLRLGGSGNGTGRDRLVVKAPAAMAAEQVKVYRKTGPGAWKLVRTTRLDRRGDAALKVRDRNGARVTRYLAKLVGSDRATRSRSNVKRLR